MAKKSGKKSGKKAGKAARRDLKQFRSITAGLADLAALEPAEFDPHGWPAGEEGERMARAVIENWARELNEDGWDQPNKLAFVSRPDVTAANLAAMGMDLTDAAAAMLEGTGHEGDPNAVMALSAVDTADFDAHPSWALWGLTVEPEINALIIAMEVWIASGDNPGRPSLDPERSEGRAFILLTRSGLYLQAASERGSEEIVFEASKPSAIGALMHQALRVPIPQEWPRLDFATYLGTAVAKQVGDIQSSVVKQLGPEGSTARGASGSILVSAINHLWAVTREGKMLTGKDKEILKGVVKGKTDVMWDDDERERVIPVARGVLAQLTWTNYLSSPQIRAVIDEESILPPFDPPTWATEDVLTTFVANHGTVMTVDDALKGIPAASRKAAVAMLDELGLRSDS